MKNFDNTANILTEDIPSSAAGSTQPIVYFRGINRIHVNRFKAYTYILSNRLNASWVITDDIKTANVVVDLIQAQNEETKSLQMSVLADTANLKPQVLSAFKLTFDEKKLVQQLNQASKLLKQTSPNQPSEAEKVIKVCGLLNESLSQICDLLNHKSRGTRFVPSVGVISSQNELYRDQLMMIVDGQVEESVLAYQALITKKLNATIVIDELIIAIIKNKDDELNEKIFDMVYNHSDDHTQVTLLNVEDEKELDVFVSYF